MDFDYDQSWAEKPAELGAKETDRVACTVAHLPADAESVLDAGCGDGRILDAIPASIRAVGVDIAQNALRRSLSRRGQVVGRLDKLPFADRSFDVVMSCEVLEHIPLPVLKAVRAEYCRVARRYILVTVPYLETLEESIVRCECGAQFHKWGHLQRFDEAALAALFPQQKLRQVFYLGSPKPACPPIFQRLRKDLGGRYSNPDADTVCPQCGSRRFITGSRNPISMIFGGAGLVSARILPKRRATWVGESSRSSGFEGNFMQGSVPSSYVDAGCVPPKRGGTVLVIAHYFPPGASSGTLRTVKFARYLPLFGWRPIVLTMTPDAFHPSRVDASLLKEISPDLEVHATPVWMPGRRLAGFRRKLLGLFGRRTASSAPADSAMPADPSTRPSIANAILQWFNFPDAYGGWLIPGLWRAWRLARRTHIDLIYSTSPSPVSHMIAACLKARTGLPWVSDYRDPWECLFPETIYVSGESEMRHRVEVKVAERCMRYADLVLANTEVAREAFCRRLPDQNPAKFLTLPNGFDAPDFDGLPMRRSCGDTFSITHAGTFFTDLRSPDEILQACRELVAEGLVDPARLRLNLVGAGSFRGDGAPYLNVLSRVSHRESLAITADSDVLLLLQQSKKYWLHIPAKAYEYLAVRKWMITIAEEDGATARFMRDLPNNLLVGPRRVPELKNAILSLYRRFLDGSLYPVPEERGFASRFSRQEQTRVLSAEFDRMCS